MKKRATKIAVIVLLCGGLVLNGCSDPDNTENNSPSNSDNINWENDVGGTLTIVNNTGYDVVLFLGTPSAHTMFGGVRAGATVVRDISLRVNDFNTGGYMVIRGMRKSIYDSNKENLSPAKTEYSGIAVYAEGKAYRMEILSESFGDYFFRVTNTSNYGIELRLNSPDGEKIAYIPSSSANQNVFTNSAAVLTFYPVYIYYDRTTNSVTTIKPSDYSKGVIVTPRPENSSTVNTIKFDNPQS